MAEAKKTERPTPKYISGQVREDLWREFRIRILEENLTVNSGLEEALAYWLAR